MQSKVSMVMTCYNKEQYIGEMFDSIISQIWDNIELILVNDGSTDGTRNIIAEYEPKFRARGFEVVIIDQENAGVCAAAKAGLERITGDYVCMVDADDELNPEYVSAMAGWLEEHEDFDVVFCGFMPYKIDNGNKLFEEERIHFRADFILTVEDYLFESIKATIWSYMLRREYFEKCHIAQSYFTDTKGSHEPGFMIPMTAHGGRAHGVELALYHHNQTGVDMHSIHDTFEKYVKHYEEYHNLINKAISALPNEVAGSAKKEAFRYGAEFFMHLAVYRRTNLLADGVPFRKQALCNLVKSAQKVMRSPRDFSPEKLPGRIRLLISAVRNVSRKVAKPADRIIGYGALGKCASYWLPILKDTPLCPTELWDINGDSATVLKPDFSSLCMDDYLLCFPIGEIENELRERFRGLECWIMYNSDIYAWYRELKGFWEKYYKHFIY